MCSFVADTALCWLDDRILAIWSDMKAGAHRASAYHRALLRNLAHSPVSRVGAASAVFFLAFDALLKSGRLDPAVQDRVTDLIFVALGLIYVPLAVRTAGAAQGRVRAAWVAMTIGFTCWLLGEIVWAYYQFSGRGIPSPGWTDVAYLAYYPWVCRPGRPSTPSSSPVRSS